jgi:polyribonucleotide nucleotidyltransferase
MGLVQDKETGEYAVLSDILGDEDHLGDWTSKSAPRRHLRCQMDIKYRA